MKNVLSSANGCNKQTFTSALIFSVMILGVSILASCKKDDASDPVIGRYTGLTSQTVSELQIARTATDRYKNIQNAITDGYADISVVVAQMGHHYMKSAYVDDKFEVNKPEILVYDKKEDGSFELVAVEYAIPLNLSTEAPAGFTGNSDVWDRNTGFGLWLLHAWVYTYNSSGVFNPTNPAVHTH
ncbi:MAG TPA: hypothetical protein VEB42_16615 [Chitinophagaceae bacterium]|nr:hypothetical protein [Chitinophagaceae bacterium]